MNFYGRFLLQIIVDFFQAAVAVDFGAGQDQNLIFSGVLDQAHFPNDYIAEAAPVDFLQLLHCIFGQHVFVHIGKQCGRIVVEIMNAGHFAGNDSAVAQNIDIAFRAAEVPVFTVLRFEIIQ